MTSFPSATSSRAQAQNDSTIRQEIAIIELTILNAIANHSMQAIVNHESSVMINGYTITSSLMTSNTTTGEDYYNVWQESVTDAVKEAQMDEVISYFTSLGYGITRIANTSVPSPANQVFYWKVTF